MEWNHGVTYQQNSTEGELFIKLPNISFPFTDSGDLILAMGNQVHTDAQISVPLEAALKSGTLDVSKIMAGAKPANCVQDSTNATFHLSTSINPHPSRAEESAITIGHYTTDIEDGVCVWKLSGDGNPHDHCWGSGVHSSQSVSNDRADRELYVAHEWLHGV